MVIKQRIIEELTCFLPKLSLNTFTLDPSHIV